VSEFIDYLVGHTDDAEEDDLVVTRPIVKAYHARENGLNRIARTDDCAGAHAARFGRIA